MSDLLLEVRLEELVLEVSLPQTDVVFTVYYADGGDGIGVTSVNGQSGVVELESDDIPSSLDLLLLYQTAKL